MTKRSRLFTPFNNTCTFQRKVEFTPKGSASYNERAQKRKINTAHSSVYFAQKQRTPLKIKGVTLYHLLSDNMVGNAGLEPTTSTM